MRMALMLFPAIFFGGCSTFYPDYKEPSDNSPATNLPSAIKKLESLRTMYFIEVKTLRKTAWQVGDWGIGGGVLGVLGAVAHSPEALLAGAGVSGTSGIIGSRYGIERQADAYWKGTLAVTCIQDKVHVLDVPSLYDASYNGIDDTEQYIVGEINRGIRAIQTKLFDRLTHQTISQPDLSQLEKALRDAGAKSKAIMVAGSEPNPAVFTTSQQAAFETALTRFDDDVSVCISSN